MSYILDALRRAEADRERERGQVPGLHTQAPPGAAAPPAPGPRRWLPWAGSGLLLLAGIGVGSWWAGGPNDAASPPQPAPLTPAVPTAVSPAPPPVATAPLPQPAASGSPYLPPVPQPVPAPAVAPRPAPVAASASAPAPAVEERIPRLSDLPEAMRRELPKLAISGSVYADDPAARFVIANGDVAREGAQLGSDLVLEQIRPREVVLRFRGQRFRQPV